ncbi:hypothetical protein SynRS9902_02580 [Synechococcus sp. RS9902]|nr:hypothetical protein SynRS9902_02580 [Synechococcus sp. RS9902]
MTIFDRGVRVKSLVSSLVDLLRFFACIYVNRMRNKYISFEAFLFFIF